MNNYIKSAWRSLRKNKEQTLINISGLAIGMGAAVLIMLWVQNELSYDTYHTNADNIYRITQTWKLATGFQKSEYASMPLTRAAKAQIPEIEQTAQIQATGIKATVLNIDNELFNEKTFAYVSENWFTFFKYKFVAGNAAAFSNDRFALLMTEQSAKKYFGTANAALGRMVRVDTVNYRVKAVVEDNPANSSFRFNVFAPASVLYSNPKALQRYMQWGNGSFITFVQLKAGTSIAKMADELDTIQKRNFKWGHGKYSLLPLKDMHFETGIEYPVIENDTDSKVGLFSLMAALLLITACINYVNLTTAVAGLRVREVSVKKIIGASRLNLFKQFITETVLIAGISLLLALLLIQLGLPFFNRFTDRNFTLALTSPVVPAILSGTFLAVVILSSIYPALLLSSFEPMDLFRGINVLKIKDEVLRKGLVIVQFTISVILIAVTVIIFKQQAYVRQHGVQYNRAQVFNILLPLNKFNDLKTDKEKDAARFAWYQSLKQSLAQEASIDAVSLTDNNMAELDHFFSDGYDYDGYAQKSDQKLTFLNTDAEYKQIFNPQLLAGRWLRNERGDQDNFVLNETAIKLLNIKQPVLGKRFSCNNVNGHIVGVIKDNNFRNLHEPIGALAIANDPYWYPYINIKAKAGDLQAALAATKKIWARYVPEQPMEYTFMDQAFDQLYRSDDKKAALIDLFTGIIILVSGMGIFGMAMHSVERRTKEISIRKVLGATVSHITLILTKDFVVLVGIAIVIASPVAWYMMNKWLEGFAYRIAVSWWMIALAGLTAVTVALVSVGFKTVKAATANPVRSLRSPT